MMNNPSLRYNKTNISNNKIINLKKGLLVVLIDGMFETYMRHQKKLKNMIEPEADSTQMLNQLTTDYLKMSDHLIKLIKLKAHSGEDQSERMIREMLQMGRQTEQLILSISTLAKQLQSDGNHESGS